MLILHHIYLPQQVTSNGQRILLPLVLLYFILIIAGLNNYFLWQSPLSWIGLAGLIFLYSSYNTGNTKLSTRYFFPAIGFILLTLVLPVKTFLYFSIVLGFSLLVESLLYKCGHLPLLLFIIISPIFNYFTTVFTFPIRLQLSHLAAQLLSFINPSVHQAGNVIRVYENDFSVDAECMGLNMVSVGLLVGILLLGYYQKKTKSTITFFRTTIFLGSVFLLIILSNLFRITSLVQFNIPQDTWGHETTGITCFIVYVILPATIFIQWLVKRKKTLAIKKIEESFISPNGIIAKNLIVCVGFFIAAVYVMKQKEISLLSKNRSALFLPGFRSEIIDRDIVKLENSNSLIYIKPIKNFYSTEHSPMICWKGSGYDLKKIKKECISGKYLYFAELCKDKDVLYTCWWFDNGNYQTIDQLDWRWKILKGANNFSIINITTSSVEQLKRSVSEISGNYLIKEALVK
ncbi:MAG: exosortase N [Bacteroidota bacterium]